MIRLVDENNKFIKMEEELYCDHYKNFLNVGDYIKGKFNRYRVVYKEVDVTYEGGVILNINIIIDNN